MAANPHAALLFHWGELERMVRIEGRVEKTSAGESDASFATRPFPISIGRAGSLLSLFFAGGPVRNLDDAKAADHDRYARFFHHLLDRGIALPPSGYELWTLGTEHGPDEVGAVLDAAGSFEG